MTSSSLNPSSTNLTWDDQELGSAPTPKEIPTVARADFGNHIDQKNAMVRQMIGTFLLQQAADRGTTDIDEDTLRQLEIAALQAAFYDGRFKTQYGEVTEYFYPMYLRIVNPAQATAELHDRVKIIWSTSTDVKTKPFNTYYLWRGKSSSELTPAEMLEELHCVSHKGNNEIISAKLVQRQDIGFVVCRIDVMEGGLEEVDFFNLEEATALEQQAKPGEKINWLQHGAYRALKMLIS